MTLQETKYLFKTESLESFLFEIEQNAKFNQKKYVEKRCPQSEETTQYLIEELEKLGYTVEKIFLPKLICCGLFTSKELEKYPKWLKIGGW